MTNPYAAPQSGDETTPTGKPWSLLTLIFVQAVVGALYAILFVSLQMHVGFRNSTMGYVGIALLGVYFLIRAWFCAGHLQSVVEALALSWGFLGTAMCCFILLAPGFSTSWIGFLTSLAVYPGVMILIGWPVIYVSRRMRQSTHQTSATGPNE